MSVVIDPNIVLDDFGKSLPDTLMAKLQERKVATPMLFSVAAASVEAFSLHVPSYVAGLEVGQRLKALRGGAVTPNIPQWSFNGEILPRLPFLGTYPHVFIEKHQLDGHEFEQALRIGDGQGSLVCCSPWGHKELDMTDQLN